ncbi:uncharacterized protein LOC125430003 [Sphaerodactylus townsendi]|uniref:uncharacterized protein LOC125430003 n=1 Tax=Sphaerodactylus townsendi TaxID=933632 RepID=UPI00202639A6|nr:uncharacterized protein LOC125430003 [Sphaerodactylus townsendi]
MAGAKKATGVRGVSWRERETLDLLSFWGEEKVQEALVVSHRNIEVFEMIAQQMMARGHKRSAVECRTKTKALRQEYKRVVAHNSRPGNSPATCPFYNELHHIFRSDVSMRSNHLAGSFHLPEAEEEQRLSESEKPRPDGLEDFFSDNVLAIKHEDVWYSTPEDECNVDETRVTDHMQQGDVAASGDQAALPEGHTVRPSTPVPEVQGEPSDAHPERPAAELSPATLLAGARNRKRRVSLLNDVAQQMLRQCTAEEISTNRRHEEMMVEDRRRHNQMVEEARLDRKAFQDAMQMNVDVIHAAVSALKTIGEAFLAQRQKILAQDRGQSGDPLNSHTSQGTQTAPPDNRTGTQDSVSEAAPNKRACAGLPTDL